MLNYKYLVIGNNDILLPDGAISAMQKILSLPGESIVVPLTTEKGAGHNPSQSLLGALNMSGLSESYVTNPYNVAKIQKSLTAYFKDKGN